MVFSSLIFLFIFLPIFLGVYYVAPKGLRNLVLFAASLIFYAWGEPIYVMIMIFSTCVDYTMGLVIHRYRTNQMICKLALGGSIFINLLVLGFFKYSNFFIDNINNLWGMNIELLKIALPVGISFYTFQTMSYTIDLYRGRIGVQKNIISFGAYVAMFPQLVAGPIVTYSTVEQELNNRIENMDDFGEGSIRFIEGLGKKVLIANNIGLLWESIKVTPLDELTLVGAWMGMMAFALQIYFDFSGYSDMAIGLGKMLGFSFGENFNYPYISKSVTEFWRRWHISLGSWFREYLYIPLGGNRVSRPRFYMNLLIVWFLTGFWHGAGWNFILWGLFFGVLMIIERIVLLKYLKKLPTYIARIYLLLVVLISWVLFSLDTVPNIVGYLKAMFGVGVGGLFDKQTFYYFNNYLISFVVAILFATPIMRRLRDRSKGWIVYTFYLGVLVLSTAYLVDSTFNPFLYFRF